MMYTLIEQLVIETLENEKLATRKSNPKVEIARKLLKALNTWGSAVGENFELSFIRGNQIRFKPVGIKRIVPSTEDFEKMCLEIGLKFDRSPVTPGQKDTGNFVMSGKFPTYVITGPDVVLGVVITGGRNKGQTFEDEIAKEAQRVKRSNISHRHRRGNERFSSLLKAMKINKSDVIDVTQSGKSSSSGRMSLGNTNVGQLVADLTITLKSGTRKLVSLKNPTGLTVANLGFAGGFIIDDNVIKPSNATGVGDKILRDLGVDKFKIANGLMSNLTNANATETINPDSTQATSIRDFLKKAYGYGYVYARLKSDNSWDVQDFEKPEDLEKYIGEIETVVIKYPVTTKQTSCLVTTSNHSFKIEIRNTKGGRLPNQINLKMLR